MIYLLFVALVVAVVTAVLYEVRMKRRAEVPAGLGDDWWPRFEAEFREYARRWEARGDTRQRTDRSRSPRPPSTRKRDVAEGSL